VKDNIIFAGCSFTWGQGLYYSNKEFTDLPYPAKGIYDHQNKLFPSEEHLKYMEENRFATQVSKHFNVLPIVKKENGGGNYTVYDFVKKQINDNTKAVVVQTTSFGRNREEDGGRGETIEEQIRQLNQLVELSESKYKVPILFFHYDWSVGRVPQAIAERTIKPFSLKFSFIDDTTNNPTINVGPQDTHFNLNGHNIVSKEIINYLKQWHNQNTHLI
jgi:hypothetical protein